VRRCGLMIESAAKAQGFAARFSRLIWQNRLSIHGRGTLTLTPAHIGIAQFLPGLAPTSAACLILLIRCKACRKSAEWSLNNCAINAAISALPRAYNSGPRRVRMARRVWLMPQEPAQLTSSPSPAHRLRLCPAQQEWQHQCHDAHRAQTQIAALMAS